MAQVHHERMRSAGQAVKLGLGIRHSELALLRPKKGTFIFDMWGADGKQLHYFEKDNLIVLDAGILGASLFKGDVPSGDNLVGLTMLAVGTGATGNLLSPDAPQPGQRRLNNEIARKPFSSTTYRNASGVAVSFKTNIVDFTTTYGESEAVGPLNEMGLMAAASANPATKNPIMNGPTDYDASIDVDGKDLLANYLTFSVVTKPATAILSITWRLTF